MIKMNEEDTFNKLRKIPPNELLSIAKEFLLDLRHSKFIDLEDLVNHYGYTKSEYHKERRKEFLRQHEKHR